MTDELVKRLRAVSYFGTTNGGTPLDGLWTEAADRIEALTAEVERMKHLTSNPADIRYWEGRYRDEAARAKAAEAERDRLREALEEIDMRGLQYNPEDLADIARAALKGESHD